MAREVIVRVWCEICLRDDVKTDAVLNLPPISIDGGEAISPEVCERHLKEFVQPVYDLIIDMGGGKKRAAPKAGSTLGRRPDSMLLVPELHPYRCPFCPIGFVSDPSMRSHFRSKHGLNAEALNEMEGLTCPLCGEDQETRRHLTHHVGNVHNLRSISEALMEAQRADPYRVVAAVTERFEKLRTDRPEEVMSA